MATEITKRKRGRPPLFGVAMTAYERHSRWQERQRERLAAEPDPCPEMAAMCANLDGLAVDEHKAAAGLDPKTRAQFKALLRKAEAAQAAGVVDDEDED